MTVYFDPSRSSSPFGQRREPEVVIKSARNEEMFDTEETKLKKRKAELESKRDMDVIRKGTGNNLNSYERAELKEINKKLEDINKLKKREHEISKMIKLNKQQSANIFPKSVSERAHNLLGSIFDKAKENQ
ncbi:hypothetical protein IJF81_02050 [bacterium]|nr:hypothetical protein [bacterium]